MLTTLKEYEPQIEAQGERVEKIVSKVINRTGDAASDAFGNVVAGIPYVGTVIAGLGGLDNIAKMIIANVNGWGELFLETSYRLSVTLKKVSPQGLSALDGTIDMVTSDHCPISIEDKKVEFDCAEFGTIGLESAFGVLNSIFSAKKTIDILTKGKSRFGVKNSSINVGNICDISLFNPIGNYIFCEKHILSKSKNSIFIGKKLKGNVYGVIANNKIEIF